MFGNKSGRSAQTVVDTLIGSQVVLRGDLTFSGGLYIEGRVIGKIIADEGGQASVTLAETGMVEGEIRAPRVVINGTLVGDVHATDKVELEANARVQGNVHYQVVEMSAGAQLTGQLIHAGAVAALPPPALEVSPASA